MNAVGFARMRAIGSILKGLPRDQHNNLLFAISPRAAPVAQWGPNYSMYPDVVRARINSLQTGDLVVCSSCAGNWAGNNNQVLTNSPWDHVAIVIRGRLSEKPDEEVKEVDLSDMPPSLKKHYVPRTPYHFHVEDDGTPHLLENGWIGTHIHADVHDRIFNSPGYAGYSTVAIRSLQGIDRTETYGTYLKALEGWVRDVRGTHYESQSDMYNLFSAASDGKESLHCAELVTEALKKLEMISPRFPSGMAPPCAYADGPYGKVKLRTGHYGPLEIIKAEDEHTLEVMQKVAKKNA